MKLKKTKKKINVTLVVTWVSKDGEEIGSENIDTDYLPERLYIFPEEIALALLEINDNTDAKVIVIERMRFRTPNYHASVEIVL